MTDRRLTLRAWLHAMSALEYRLAGEQRRARNAMIRQAAAEYEKLGHPPAHVFISHRARVRALLDEHYTRTIPVFARMARQQITRQRKQRSFADLTQEFITREALRKATMIADTDRDDVINAISTGAAEGLGTEEIARNIRKVSQLTPFRAAVVARTETHAAATFGSVESVRRAEQELGVRMLKEWLPTMDDRTREDHRAMAGRPPIPLDEKFIVGGVPMDRPGDPSAPPELVIACRCALAFSEATE